jgi:hypothetical protein
MAMQYLSEPLLCAACSSRPAVILADRVLLVACSRTISGEAAVRARGSTQRFSGGQSWVVAAERQSIPKRATRLPSPPSADVLMSLMWLLANRDPVKSSWRFCGAAVWVPFAVTPMPVLPTLRCATWTTKAGALQPILPASLRATVHSPDPLSSPSRAHIPLHLIIMKFTFAILAVLLASVSATPVLETRNDLAIIERSSNHPKRGAAFNAAGAVSPLASKWVIHVYFTISLSHLSLALPGLTTGHPLP